MAISNYFKGAVSALAGVGMLAGTALADDIQPVSLQPQGKHVTLRVGPGFNPLGADAVARYVRENGNCTAEVTTEKGLPKRLTLDVAGERPFRFSADEIGSAAAAALLSCRQGPA